MPTPHSYIRRFIISEIAFMHHHAQDSHGTIVDTYCVNGEEVSFQEFNLNLQTAVGDAEYYISRACGLIKNSTPDWSSK